MKANRSASAAVAETRLGGMTGDFARGGEAAFVSIGSVSSMLRSKGSPYAPLVDVFAELGRVLAGDEKMPESARGSCRRGALRASRNTDGVDGERKKEPRVVALVASLNALGDAGMEGVAVAGLAGADENRKRPRPSRTTLAGDLS